LVIQRLTASVYPCLATLWQGYAGTILVGDTYLIRCWMLYFNFVRAQKIVSESGEDENAIRRARRLMSVKFLFKWVIWITIIEFIPAIVLSVTDESIRESLGDQQCNRGTADYLLGVVAIAYAAMFVIFGFKLRKVSDGFFIKEELRAVSLTGIATFVPWVLFNNINDLENVNDTSFPISTLVLFLGIAFVFFFGTVNPLRKSYKMAATKLVSSLTTSDKVDSFPKLLKNKDGFDSFKAFLSSEFSVEIALFWRACEQYAQSYESMKESEELNIHSKLLSEAARINKRFVAEDAPLEVKLSDGIKSKIVTTLASAYIDLDVLVNMFALASKEVFDRMSTEMYGRYLASDYYQQLSSKLRSEDKKKNAFEILEIV